RWAWAEFADFAVPVRELSELRLGVFGLGGIGSAIARRGVALGMNVAGIRARPARGGPAGARWVGGLGDLPRLVAESDCLVIAAPHTAETRGAVSRAVRERLPHDAIVVNVSRGTDRKSTRLNSSHVAISYAVFCLKKKIRVVHPGRPDTPAHDR